MDDQPQVGNVIDAADAFRPLTNDERQRADLHEHADAEDATGAADTWQPELPAPSEPPEAGAIEHWKHGRASARWDYRDAAGRPMFSVVRFDTADGKEVLPYTFGTRTWTAKSGAKKGQVQTVKGWHFKRPPPPLPLYGIDHLAAQPSAPVVVVEGEKTAEAARNIITGVATTTSQGGSKAAEKSDWSPVRGRHVIIWPDHDQAGVDYAAAVARLSKKAGAASVRIVTVPEDWPEGWDVADPLPGGVALDHLRQLLDEARAAADLPDGYFMTPNGLFFQPLATKKDPDPESVFVAGKFEVIGRTRSVENQDWGLLLRWHDPDGHSHHWALPLRLIHGRGNEIAAELENCGLPCGTDENAHRLLKRFLSGVKVDRRLRSVSRTGWYDGGQSPVFVLPGGQGFGRGAEHVILQTEHVTATAAFGTAGSLTEWRQTVAAPAVGNDRLVLSVSIAFTPPLLHIAREPSGGFNLVGESRIGKSTLLMSAASVWGKPTSEGQLRSWRATANGLEGAAAETSDTLLALDEMGQGDARGIGDVVYMLANESGKQRASSGGGPRRRQSWRTTFLSTSEVTLAQKMGEVGERPTAGQEVRLVNVTADAGAGRGVFQMLHGRPNAAALADELRANCMKHYGHAARDFLQQLTGELANDVGAVRGAIEELRAEFLQKHLPADAAGQVRSVAQRFALAAAAGEMAAKYSILPWPKGEAIRAAGACLAAWIGDRGGVGAAEDATALAKVRGFIEMHGESRFTPLLRVVASTGGANSSKSGTLIEEGAAPESDAPLTVNRAGFRRLVPPDPKNQAVTPVREIEYLFLPEAWKNEVCKGLNASRVADLLIKRGFMRAREYPRHRSEVVTITGMGKIRVYRVSGKILEG